MVQAIFLTLSTVIPSLAVPIARASLDCNSGICTTVTDGAPVLLGFPSSILRHHVEKPARDLLVPGIRYVRDSSLRDLSPSTLPSRRKLSVELEAREPIVILPGMNPDIDTRLPWNRQGPRVLVLKHELMEELD